MVELIEYVLVFAVSAGVAGAGLAVVGGAMPGLEQVSYASVADQIGAAASLAVAQGRSVSVVVPLADATVACDSGTLSVTEGGSTRDYALYFPCSFDLRGLDGDCTLDFSSADAVALEAAC
ncbi:MAG: hypothetical protein JRN23_03245 [Nitrososphaerota archaeon]|nr:hypothetical protein [Nitrososphaerota archaeon]